jgi:hypothetical protein
MICEWNSWVNVFMVYNIDIHQLNLRPFKNLKFWMKFHSKFVFVFAFLSNKCIIVFSFKENHYHIKEEEIL